MRVANKDTATAQKHEVVTTPTFFIINKAGRLYRLSGLEQIRSAMDNSNDAAWKQ